MPIKFPCRYCGTEITIPDEYGGKTGVCGSCGKKVKAPRATKSSCGLAAVIKLGIPLVAVIGIVIALLLPAVSGSRGAARREACLNNLKQIGLAMKAYHDRYRCFPPAYVADENGKPMHSWRVLLLPYLEKRDVCNMIHSLYDFDEPWNGPNNRTLNRAVLDVYKCPSDFENDRTETSYLMIVGPGTISDGPGTTNIRNITDDISNTILLIEVANSGINWMEPRDLDANETLFKINEIEVDGVRKGISSYHIAGVHILMCDGSVHFLPEGTDPETIKAMTTIAGGEPVDPLP